MMATHTRRRHKIRFGHLESLETRYVLASLSPEVLLSGDDSIVPAAGPQQQNVIAPGEDQHGNPVTLAVWTDFRGALNQPPSVGTLYVGAGLGRLTDIYAARIDADGHVLDTTPIVVNQDEFYQSHPQVAWNGTNWLVTWMGEREGDRNFNDVYAARVAPDGEVLDPQPILVLPGASTLDSYQPYAVTSNGDEWLVIHTHMLGHVPFLAFAGTRVAADGSIVNPGGTIVSNTSSHPGYTSDAAFISDASGGRYIVSYQRGVTGYVRIFDEQLQPLSGEINVNPGLTATAPQIAVNGDRWGLVFSADSGDNYRPTWFRTLETDGILGPRILVEDDDGPYLWFEADIAPKGTGFAVVRDSWRLGVGNQIFGWEVDVSGSVSSRVDIGGPDAWFLPRAAHVGNHVQVIYVAIPASTDFYTTYIAGVHLAGSVTRPETPISLAAPRQSQVDLADNGSGFLAVWRSDSTSTFSVMAQRLTASGASIDPEPEHVGDIGPTESPAVAFNGSVYLVTWSRNNQIFGRLVDVQGQPIGAAPFYIMDGNHAAVDALDDTFLVAGTFRQSVQIRYTVAARVNGQGQVLDTPRLQLGANFDEFPAVQGVGSKWLVAWERNITHDNERSDIHLRFVNPNGTLSPVLTLDAASFDDEPALAYDGTNALVVWESGDIWGRRIDVVAESPLGPVISISSAPNLQTRPRVAFDGTDYVVTWIDQRNWGFPNQNRDDVYAARVSTAGVVLDPQGFAIANSDLPETAPTVAVSDQGAVYAYSKLVNDAPFGTYRLVTRTEQTMPGDFNGDGNLDCADVDALVAAIVGAEHPPVFDLTGNGLVDVGDLEYWLAIAGAENLPSGNTYLWGDANLDGDVDGLDFTIWNANKFTNQAAYCSGDFNADGIVDGIDFSIWNAHKFQSANDSTTSLVVMPFHNMSTVVAHIEPPARVVDACFAAVSVDDDTGIVPDRLPSDLPIPNALGRHGHLLPRRDGFRDLSKTADILIEARELDAVTVATPFIEESANVR